MESKGNVNKSYNLKNKFLVLFGVFFSHLFTSMVLLTPLYISWFCCFRQDKAQVFLHVSEIFSLPWQLYRGIWGCWRYFRCLSHPHGIIKYGTGAIGTLFTESQNYWGWRDLFLDGLAHGQCLGGLPGSILYGFGHIRKHYQCSIFGQILKEAKIADHLRVIHGCFKYLVHKHLMSEFPSLLQWNLPFLGICSVKRTENWFWSLRSSAYNWKHIFLQTF